MIPMRRVAAVLALLLLLALVVWIIARRADQSAHEDAGKPRAPAVSARRFAPDLDRLVLLSARARSSDAQEASVSGRVVSRADGRGVPSADVGFAFAGAVHTVVTDGEGAFRFVAPRPGAFQLGSAEADGFFPYVTEPGQSPVRLQLDAGVAFEGLIIELAPRVDYQGLVTDLRSRPIAGAEIEVLTGSELAPGDRYVSDAEGAFTFQAPDGALLEATHPEYRARRVRVDFRVQLNRQAKIRLAPRDVESDEPSGEMPGITGSSAVVADDGVLTGAVTDAQGAVTAFAVIIEEVTGPLARRWLRTPMVFDAGGRFTVEGLPRSRLVVAAVAAGYAPSAPAAVDLTTSPRADVALRLEEGRVLRGRVVDAVSGRGLGGARVSLERQMAPAPIPMEASVRTDQDGSFELGGLSPGRVSIEVLAVGYHARIVPAVIVPEVGDPEPVNIELTPVEPDEEPALELAGIGAMLGAEGDGLRVIQVIPGGGAAEVGLAAGDIVMAVDGQPASVLGFVGAIELIRGPVGTFVRLRVRRADGTEVEINVPRRKIRT